jgi:hypothetical protein
MPAARFSLVGVLGKLWTSPNSIIGILLGAVGVLFGARVRRGYNAIWFINYPIGRGALTLGNVVLATRGWEPEAALTVYGVFQQVGPHEEAHTRQYEVLGPFFGLAYLLLPGAFTARSPFERAATLYATGLGGWWPGTRRGTKRPR